ncbi:MAG: hypothetical protein HZA24_10940 [Nitrospirae bacterium]|nr:hypothetical protein [Nitrospirota bacterium]
MLCLLLFAAAPAWAQEVSLRAQPERAEGRAAVGEAVAEGEAGKQGWVAWFLDTTGTTVSGYVRNETAYRYVTPSSFSKILNVVRLQTLTSIGDNAELTLVPRAWYDAVYDIEDIDTVHPRRGPTTILTQEQTPEVLAALEADNTRLVKALKYGAELREYYLDYHFDNADLRVGKQIVRWGVVEGARVTDEINPLDFKEFILRDVQDRYIPLNMVRLDYYLNAGSVQLLWIPDIKTHKPAPVGTEYEQFQYLPDLRVPESGIANAEYAIKYNFNVYDADLAVSFFDTWDDFPAAFRSIRGVGADAKFGETPTVDFVPEPPRLKILGFAGSRAMAPGIWSMEAAYVHNKVFGTFLGAGVVLPAEAVGGEIQRDYYKWAVNLDFSKFGIDWSVQYLQATIIGYTDAIIADKNDIVQALFARKTLFDNVLTAQILAIHFQNDQEWVLRPRGDVLLTSRIKLSVGADIMAGRIADTGPRGEPMPGQFHFAGFFQNSSRVYMEVAYQF